MDVRGTALEFRLAATLLDEARYPQPARVLRSAAACMPDGHAVSASAEAGRDDYTTARWILLEGALSIVRRQAAQEEPIVGGTQESDTPTDAAGHRERAVQWEQDLAAAREDTATKLSGIAGAVAGAGVTA